MIARFYISVLVFSWVATFFPLSLFASDVAAGKKAAVTCIACHGPTGMSVSPIWPNLAGQKKDYLVKQIQAFRKDERKDPLMSPLAKTLLEADIENVAEYFSSL